jgi:chemotaxis protein methyltransferase CheR
MRVSMDTTEFKLLKDFIENEFGLSLKTHDMEGLAKKLKPRLNSLKLNSFLEYYNYLLKPSHSEKELANLISVIINMESYFLREKAQFDVFINLLNKIKAEKIGKPSKTIKILSAGCSTGEEPYSILMSIRNSGIQMTGWTVKIFAFDLDPSTIRKSKHGVYNSYSLRGVDKKIIQKFFHKTKNNCYKINDDIIKSVTFFQGNLLHPTIFSYLKNLDFIFCRNVLIYMSKKATNKIALNLWEALLETGYLFLGQSESFIRQDALFKTIHFPHTIIYQKKIPKARKKVKS